MKNEQWQKIIDVLNEWYEISMSIAQAKDIFKKYEKEIEGELNYAGMDTLTREIIADRLCQSVMKTNWPTYGDKAKNIFWKDLSTELSKRGIKFNWESFK